MKSKLIVLSTLTLLLSATGHAGDKGGNGGNGDAQKIKLRIVDIFRDLYSAYGANYTVNEKNIPLKKIVDLLPSLRVEAVPGPLYKDGKIVDAKNYPDENRIEYDVEKFDKVKQGKLMVHEVLGLARFDDETYDYSGDIAKEHSRLFFLTYKHFPVDTQYQLAHLAWAESRFSSVKEAHDFIYFKPFACSFVGWSSRFNGSGTGLAMPEGSEVQSLFLQPNEWKKSLVIHKSSSATYAQPLSEVRSTPLGDSTSIGISTVLARNGAVGGPAVLKDGKVVTDYNYTAPNIFNPGRSKVKALAGKLGDRVFIKYMDLTDQGSTNYETIYVCDSLRK